MFLRLRYLTISLIFGTLSLAAPLAALAQGFAQLPAPAGQAAQPSPGLTAPSIGNATIQRQQRPGQQVIDPRTGQLIDSRTGLPIDPRTGQPLQPEIQPPPERIEFQDFVRQSTGRDLPIFGSELFRNVPSTFAPVDNIPVTSDYVIGPGDEILIRAWGQLDVDFSAMVDRTGAINIPRVGTINVAGIKYQDLQSHIKAAIGRVFRNFDLTVSLGQLRAIQVFVVGQARTPGSYTVSSMSTLVNAVFAAGGPSAQGSMRSIQLKRGNKVVTELDLYDLLIDGDKSSDARLLPGDVIYFPPVGALVAISGSVNVPAIFELKRDGTLADLIAWAGGLASTASGQKATVERIENHKTRKVAEFRLDAAGMRTPLRNGDLATIYAVASRIENAVTLRGNVAQPARFPWREGMRVKDLIPDSSALISRDYWLRKNQATRLNRADAALDETQKLSTGLGAGQGVQALEAEKLKASNADTIRRNLSEVNWNYAVIERLDPRDLATTLVPFNLGKAVLEGDPAQNLLLQPGDVVTIFSVDDIQVPIAAQTKYVRLEGEFVNPGIYRVEPGETLRQLVARVGGLTPNAYLFGAEFTRESNRIYQQKKLEEAVKRLEREIQASAISRAKNVTSTEEAAGLTQDAQAQQALIAKLREVKATGRIVLELPADGSAGLKDLPEIALEDSDRLVVPSRPSMVNVIGSVYNENAFVYRPEKDLGDYLQQAGGVSKTGDKGDVYLLRADGSVISKRQSGWLMGSLDGTHLMPGDTIVVPEEYDRTTWTKTFKDWGQILYQFGLGAAAIKVIRD
jgi:protein involved in polysaccharide export with SLBB domain